MDFSESVCKIEVEFIWSYLFFSVNNFRSCKSPENLGIDEVAVMMSYFTVMI